MSDPIRIELIIDDKGTATVTKFKDNAECSFVGIEPAAKSAETEDIQKQIRGILFSVRRSVRYHNKRRLFFDRVHKCFRLLSVLTGAATIASVLAKAGPIWTVPFAVAVAFFSVIDLVVGTTQAARLHNDLSKRFFDLEKSIIAIKDFTDQDIISLTYKRHVLGII